MLVGGGFALLAVLIAGGIVAYVLHDGGDSAASLNPFSTSSATAPPAAVAAGGTSPASPAAPPAGPGTGAPKGAVAPPGVRPCTGPGREDGGAIGKLLARRLHVHHRRV